MDALTQLSQILQRSLPPTNIVMTFQSACGSTSPAVALLSLSFSTSVSAWPSMPRLVAPGRATLSCEQYMSLSQCVSLRSRRTSLRKNNTVKSSSCSSTLHAPAPRPASDVSVVLLDENWRRSNSSRASRCRRSPTSSRGSRSPRPASSARRTVAGRDRVAQRCHHRHVTRLQLVHARRWSVLGRHLSTTQCSHGLSVYRGELLRRRGTEGFLCRLRLDVSPTLAPRRPPSPRQIQPLEELGQSARVLLVVCCMSCTQTKTSANFTSHPTEGTCILLTLFWVSHLFSFESFT